MSLIVEFVKKLWADRRVRIVFLIVAIVISIVMIWWIVVSNTQKKSTDNAYLIDVPLSFNTNHSVDIASDIYKDNKFPKTLPVYPISKIDQLSSVDRFLLSTGRSTMKKTNVQNVYYTWSKNEDSIQYLPNNLQLTFKFSTPININSGVGLITKDNADDYINNLLKNYFGKDYTYINVNIINQGNRIRLEFNRSIEGRPLYLSGLDSFSDYLVVDSSGRLYQGSLNLIDFNITQKENIDIIDVSRIGSMMKSDLYPKKVFQGSYPNTFPIPTTKKLDDADVIDLSNQIPIATSSTARSVTLGYFFFDTSYTQLVPVYRIESEGSVVYKSKSYKVPIVVIANALDPKRVYLPK